ncbi:DUF4435 domain-containing protein [Vibrio harveyi]|nr:DUF4435 domain-containing protein [Vibrio harveyi]
MEHLITPQRIANSIQQDNTFTGHYLLVEGRKDITLFNKFVDHDNCRLKPTFGKYKQREVYEILEKRGFKNKLAIRDADFIRMPNNPKFDVNYNKAIFLTDYHDSEGMIINSLAFRDFLVSISNDDELKKFSEKFGDIYNLAYKLCLPLAYLRLANKKYDLGLSFKPEKPEGNKFKFKKIICDKNFVFLGVDSLINVIYEYSKNRGKEVSSRADIKSKLELIMQEDIDQLEAVNGHDLCQVLYILCSKGLKSKSKLLNDSDSIEEMLSLTYAYDYFRNSQLFKQIDDWQKTHGVAVIGTP